MPDGINVTDIFIDQLKQRFGPKQQPPEWGAWSHQSQPGQAQRPGQEQPQSARPGQYVPEQKQVNLRPEQQVGVNRADQQTVANVSQAVDSAKRQSNRQQASAQFQAAINAADSSKDGSLQALAKVEFGLANLNWGHTETGFKWLLEAGSNNPSIYNPQQNQNFLKRLGQAGLPQSAVDSLMANGMADPNWYLKDPEAYKKLDGAMTGTPYIAPGSGMSINGDSYSPPAEQAEQKQNPNYLDQRPQQASDWMKQLFNGMLTAAGEEQKTNKDSAFRIYKQAVAKADEYRDPVLQAQARIETGLAVMSWGKPEAGYKWLLDAGSKNPAIYDARYNQGLINRLKRGGMTDSSIDTLMSKGKDNPNWYKSDSNAASDLANGKVSKPVELPRAPAVTNPIERPNQTGLPIFNFKPNTVPIPGMPGRDESPFRR